MTVPTATTVLTEIPFELIHQLPKTDLHCHLDGSLRLETILELARKQGNELPTTDRGELHRLLVAGEHIASLDDYLRAFDITLSVMQTEAALERCAYELAEDAWRENVRYLEVRYSPLLHTREGLRPAQVVEAVLRGLRMAKRELGIRYGLILCAIRSLGPESSLRIAELCVAFKNGGVVGFDLAGSEVNNPAKLHRHAFQLVIDNNINCTAHAGESFGPDSVHQAIHKCGAHRIGHGTRLIESGEMLNYVNDHRIPLEVCPTSNMQTRAAQSWETHPVDFYVDYGLRVTINTDNRLMSDTTVSRELHLCHRHYGWSLQTIKEIIIAGFKSAFMPYREKSDLLAEISRELSQYEDPRGEVTGRAGLVETDPPTSAPRSSPTPPATPPKLELA
ncbi:MAG: adenosine deaminase [Myxococcota bacterium]|nr:adenosine deaminase [Myxococcota bacterium]